MEWHLTAETKPVKQAAFVTLIHPHRQGETPPTNAALKEIDGGYFLRADLADGRVAVLLRTRDAGVVAAGELRAVADVAAVRFDKAGKPVAHVVVDGREVTAGKGALP